MDIKLPAASSLRDVSVWPDLSPNLLKIVDRELTGC